MRGPGKFPRERREPARGGRLVLLRIVDAFEHIDLIVIKLEEIKLLRFDIEASVVEPRKSLQEHKSMQRLLDLIDRSTDRDIIVVKGTVSKLQRITSLF